MDAAHVGMSGEYVGLLVILITTPNLHGPACRGMHALWDAALTDELAAEQARDICLHRCACLAQCAAWSATLSRRQRAELGVVAGIIPQPEPSPEQARKPASLPAQATRSARQASFGSPTPDQRCTGAAKAHGSNPAWWIGIDDQPLEDQLPDHRSMVGQLGAHRHVPPWSAIVLRASGSHRQDRP